SSARVSKPSNRRSSGFAKRPCLYSSSANASSARRERSPPAFRFTRPLLTPSLYPSDGRTDTDLEQLGRLASRRPRFDCSDYSLTQVTRVRLWHRWPPTGESMPADLLISMD